MTPEIWATLLGNGVIVAVLTVLAAELRRDVREIRDKVLILWEAHEKKAKNRRKDDTK